MTVPVVIVVPSDGPKFPLSDGTIVELVSSKPLTLDTFEELIDYLNVYKKVLAKKEATKQKASVGGKDLSVESL